MIADSRVVYNERDQTIDCPDCLDRFHVFRRTLSDPDAFVELLEMLQLDHAECPKYKDARRARNARRYRKEGKRLALVQVSRA